MICYKCQDCICLHIHPNALIIQHIVFPIRAFLHHKHHQTLIRLMVSFSFQHCSKLKNKIQVVLDQNSRNTLKDLFFGTFLEFSILLECPPVLAEKILSKIPVKQWKIGYFKPESRNRMICVLPHIDFINGTVSR